MRVIIETDLVFTNRGKTKEGKLKEKDKKMKMRRQVEEGEN